MRPGYIRLFRAVMPAELDDLRAHSAFRNPPGAEVKYFVRHHWDAVIYAELASARFGEGPYYLVATWLPSDLLSPEYEVTIERRIVAVVLSTDMLPLLDAPDFLGEMP